MAESPLVQALKDRRAKMVPVLSESEQLLKLILSQVTRMADSLATDTQDDKEQSVTTQESHAP